MIRPLLIMCAITRTLSEMEAFQRQMYISRKSRANSNPIQTGYVYSKIGDGPGLMTTFDNSYVKPTEKQTSVTNDEDSAKNNTTSTPSTTVCEVLKSTVDENKDEVNASTSEQNEERVKAETKYILLKDKDKEAIEQHLKSIMPVENSVNEMFINYDSHKFRLDDEDVRTDSTNNYNGWPYSYHGPYEYQIKKVETQKEKAKDKRILLAADTSIIPVHENIHNDIPNSPVRTRANFVNYNGAMTTDNPNYGNQPFFSFVLNDYFDRNNEEYPLSFKDFSWGEEFDHGVPYQDIDDSGRRIRRLEDNKLLKKRQGFGKNLGKLKHAHEESVSERTYENNQEYDKLKNSDEQYDHQEIDHDHKRRHQFGFRDFVDAFANQFGSENLIKDSNFMLTQNQDKGENKKGFRRVYHKDEYQEDNEFFDKSNKNGRVQENGGSNFNIGGSQAVLKTGAAVSTGNEGNALTGGSAANKIIQNSNKRNKKHKGYEGDINRYRNIAKDAAQSNSADYIDQYGI